MKVMRCSSLLLFGLVAFLAGCGNRSFSHLTLDVGQDPKQPVPMHFILIPAGDFMMGSSSTETDRKDDEGPVHKVTLSKPFYIGVYEVTQQQYEAVMGENPSRTKAVDHPVESVSWNAAQKFCEQMSSRTGKKVRLPTEAEWEYVCRAGTTSPWSFGADERQLGYFAWYKGNAASDHHPVGQKKPNPWGLFDMHGNVAEMVFDRSTSKYDPNVAVDPTGSSTAGAVRVARGGSFKHEAVDLRTARRLAIVDSAAQAETGLRLVVEKE